MLPVLFFLSGFCALLYQIVWLRLAFAEFGIITPVVSVVLSIFMLGMALGSWIGARLTEVAGQKSATSAMRLYASSELFIGVGGILVPWLFSEGGSFLLTLGELDSFSYLFWSAIILAASILPWCLCMGATLPLGMSCLHISDQDSSTSFSLLYLANVLGAISGVVITGIVLIETMGFSSTLKVAACINLVIAIVGFLVAANDGQAALPKRQEVIAVAREKQSLPSDYSKSFVYGMLFVSGFCSIGMEVVWTRAFTPITITTVYAFVLLLTAYLIGTAEGGLIYRRHLREGIVQPLHRIVSFVAITAFLPLVLNDPRLNPSVLTVVLSLVPFCGGLGYLTPLLIDRYSRGLGYRAGRVYAINILGCVLGPLCSGYVLLPVVGVKWSLIVLALPFTFLYVAMWGRPHATLKRSYLLVGVGALAGTAALLSDTFEEAALKKGDTLRRDYTATVIARSYGTDKYLFVNGIGLTHQTVITKVMAHLPLICLDHEPKSALVLCFGIGTTFRSAMSWGIDVTAVELVPSVAELFGFFYKDGIQLLQDERAKLVIDDGRRYLKRTQRRFDMITIDPPPPVEAAGSSLLYSEEFYHLAKSRLSDGGILQQWLPGAERETLHAVVGSLKRRFPYVRVFRSVEGWGFHFLASTRPIRVPGGRYATQLMPLKARRDLGDGINPGENVSAVLKILSGEVPLPTVSDAKGVLTVTDDRPFNEYYVLRRTISEWKGTFEIVR